MIGFSIDDGNIVHATPHGKISETDIRDTAGPQIDRLLRDKGHLSGVLVDAREFEGWEDFSAFAAHVKFIKDHHDKVDKIAVINGGENHDFLKRIFSLVPHIEFRFFAGDEEQTAEQWLQH